MHCVKKSVLVPYRSAQMFELVDDVEAYPQFLPWCGGRDACSKHSTIARRRGSTSTITAFARTSRRDNVNRPPEAIVITLNDGPFRHLHGEWRFRALGKNGCRVEFDLAYEFATALLDKAIGPVFGHIAGTLIDAFVRRAEAVYVAG